jgi:hypothetical protein
LFFFFTFEGGKSSSNVPVETWVETSQFRNQVIMLRPGGIGAAIFGAPGIEPRILSVIPQTCAFANIPVDRCQEVPGGLDLGSPTGMLGTVRRRI